MSNGPIPTGILVVHAVEDAGRAIVLRAAASGAAIVFSVPAAEARLAHGILRDARAASAGAAIEFVCADSAREDDIERLFDHALTCMPAIGAVVACARTRRRRTLLDTSLEEWEEALRHDLRGAFLVARRAVEEFLGQGAGGRLVLVGPADDGSARSSATIGALRGIARSAAKEVGRRGITCNVVIPGAPLDTATVADAAMFLAGPGGAFVSGDVWYAAAPASAAD